MNRSPTRKQGISNPRTNDVSTRESELRQLFSTDLRRNRFRVLHLMRQVSNLTALGQSKRDLVVAAQEFPITVEADGLLGLDFFRGLILNLDFSRGRISLRPPRPRWQFWR